jgi:hypothetical protein
MKHRLLALALAVAALVGLGATPAAAHNPQDWQITFVTYRSVDAYCGSRHIVAHMTDAEMARARDAQEAMVAALNSWQPYLDVTARYTTRSVLRDISPYRDNAAENGCGIDRSKIANGSDDPDTTMVFVDPQTDGGYWWYQHGPGWRVLGTAWMCGTCRNFTTQVGSGYSATVLRDVAVHEWLHGAGAFYRAKGRYVPDPHWKGDYDSSWSDWYYYSRTVKGNLPDRNGDGYLDGISHRAVHVGTPNAR